MLKNDSWLFIGVPQWEIHRITEEELLDSFHDRENDPNPTLRLGVVAVPPEWGFQEGGKLNGIPGPMG